MLPSFLAESRGGGGRSGYRSTLAGRIGLHRLRRRGWRVGGGRRWGFGSLWGRRIGRLQAEECGGRGA